MTTYENLYECSCGTSWTDFWSSACDDECHACGCTINPAKSWLVAEEGDDHPCNVEDLAQDFSLHRVEVCTAGFLFWRQTDRLAAWFATDAEIIALARLCFLSADDAETANLALIEVARRPILIRPDVSRSLPFAPTLHCPYW